ncbi:MAG: aspartyl/glutamyl-tRNA(Asn/Gln) amidotransferase subunit B [Bacteroidia bacterium]|nr:MAG: aspartyl/glutamyl-tRNA(Asn/Gln) amidotransferase subunit B [Bacteroidia bacterium]
MSVELYEPVIGLECHIQLLTNSKMYSSDSTSFGDMPNTHISEITLGYPGTLPKVNKKALEFAVKLGLSVNANITGFNGFARKNYFYPDLPKGYQITQDKTPVCTGGKITFRKKDGTLKEVRLIRIHMEEDAGKNLHDLDPDESLVDFNRAGTPLLEMVSEADIRSGEEAYLYLQTIRKLVRYLEICDGNMEEGSLRCDVNVSVRKKGETKFGTKVEVKNINSFRNVQRAIDYEIQRQIDLLEKGETIISETRSFDAIKGITFSLRTKELANDYRYFPEPDLPPILITQEYIQNIRQTLPPLPDELYAKYTTQYQLSDYDASVITEDKEFALWFNELCQHTSNYKSAANWLTVVIKAYLNETALHISDFKIKPNQIAQIIHLIDNDKISYTAATQKLFPTLLNNPGKDIEELCKELDIFKNTNVSDLQPLIEDVFKKYPEKIAEYKAGKKGLLGLFVGEVMKLSKGKADPKLVNQIVKEKLEG